jgi:hypothetical protein
VAGGEGCEEFFLVFDFGERVARRRRRGEEGGGGDGSGSGTEGESWREMESVRLVRVMMEDAATRWSQEVIKEAMMAFLWVCRPMSERLMEMVRLVDEKVGGAGNGEVRSRFLDLFGCASGG